MKLIEDHAYTVAAVLGLAVISCASSSDLANAEGEVSTFACPSGEAIATVFPEDPEGDITVAVLNREAILLPRVEAASGAKYSDGAMTFWERGGEAIVAIDGEIVLQGCTLE